MIISRVLIDVNTDDSSLPGNIKLCSQFPDEEGRGIDDTCYKDLNVKFDGVKQNF